MDRALEGFGYATVRLQLHHVIGAERYWVGVIQGRMEADDDDAAFATIAALQAFRERIAAQTRAYIGGASPQELSTPRPMVVWGGAERALAPARIVLRVTTHVYQHTGQVAAMCRLLGRPVQGMEFPIV